LYSKLRYLEPRCELRECFTYNNLMYMVAGRLVEETSGGSWEGFVADRVLRPLRMRRSFFGHPPVGERDVALPHGRGADGAPVRVQFYDGWAVGPASSLYSCAEDMARWLLFQLGARGEEFIVSRETLHEIHRPQMIVQQPATTAFPLTSYGMGWFVQTYRGRLLLWHAGTIDGYYAWAGFLPFDQLGIAVLTNRTAHRVPEVVSRWIIDRFLGLGEIDWHTILTEQEEGIRTTKEGKLAAALARGEASGGCTGPLEHLAGLYRHPAYGDLQVSSQDDRLSGTFHGISGEIECLFGDRFVFRVSGEVFRDTFELTFQRDAGGKVVSVASPLAKGVAPVVFVRVAAEGGAVAGAAR
jgi:hypothetical protein